MPRGRRFDGRILGIERQRRAALRPELRELLAILGEKAVPSELLDEELQAIRLLVLVVAELVEDANHRLGHVEDLRRGQEVVHRLRGLHHDRRAAADDDAEAALAVLDGRAIAEIVHAEQRVVFVGAAFERDLEFARQRRAERMPQQVARHRLRVRRDVEELGRRHAGLRAAGDVAHRVAARLARRQPRVGEYAHRGLDVVELHEMELDVLPRGDVAEAARELLAYIGERLELRGGEDALRNLDAQHLHVAGLPLAVGAPHEAEHAPLIGRQLAALELLERGDKLVDVGLARERKAGPSERLGIVYGCHG